jgi:hypothetical protein
VNQGLREGYHLPVIFFAIALLAAGMFGLLVIAGAYLGLVRSSAPWHGMRRRLVDAAAVTSAGVLVPFAFRYHLWWLVGTTNAHASLGQLVELLLLSAGVIFTVVMAAEWVSGRHAEPARSP